MRERTKKEKNAEKKTNQQKLEEKKSFRLQMETNDNTVLVITEIREGNDLLFPKNSNSIFK